MLTCCFTLRCGGVRRGRIRGGFRASRRGPQGVRGGSLLLRARVLGGGFWVLRGAGGGCWPGIFRLVCGRLWARGRGSRRLEVDRPCRPSGRAFLGLLRGRWLGPVAAVRWWLPSPG